MSKKYTISVDYSDRNNIGHYVSTTYKKYWWNKSVEEYKSDLFRKLRKSHNKINHVYITQES